MGVYSDAQYAVGSVFKKKEMTKWVVTFEFSLNVASNLDLFFTPRSFRQLSRLSGDSKFFQRKG